MPNAVQITIEVDRDQNGRTTLRQIDREMAGIGQTATKTGAQVDGAIALFKGAILAEFFRRGAREAVAFGEQSVRAFNEAKAAALGLQSIAIFKGFSGTDALEQVKNLDVIKAGLLSLADASQVVKNFLKTGFSLDQAITLTERFADAAAFGKAGSLSFAEAVRSGSEGVATQSSQLLNNVGIVTNLSTILERAGLTLDDLTSKTKGQAAVQALYRGLLNETADASGNAAKLTDSFAGAQARLDAIEGKLLVTVGELITKNPEIAKGIEELATAIESFTKEASTPGSEVNRTLTDFISLGGKAVQTGAELITFVKEYAGELSALIKLAAGLGGAFALNKIIQGGVGLAANLTGIGSAGSGTAGVVSAVANIPTGRRLPGTGETLPVERGTRSLLDSFEKSAKSVNTASDAVNKLTSASNQASSGLSKLKEFATGGVSSGFVARAGVIGSIAAVLAEAITGAIREASEKRLAATESTVNLGIGPGKDIARRQQELERLVGIANSGKVGEQTGGAFDLPSLNLRIAQTQHLISVQKEEAQINKTLADLEEKRAGGASLATVEQGLRETTRFENLKEFAASAQKTAAELQRLTGEDKSASLNARIQGVVVPGAELSDAVIAREKAIDAAKTNLLEGTISDISALRKELSDNPFVNAFDAAEKRAIQFNAKLNASLDAVKAKMKEVPDELIRDVEKSRAEFDKLNERLRSLDTFKAGLAKTDRLESLLEEQDKLRAGLGGQTNRDKFTDRDAEHKAIIREIEQKRGAGILGKDEHFSLLNKLSALDNVSPLDRLEREFTARRIASDQAALSQAGDDPLKQSLALDRLLSHTSDIGKLSAEQIGIREDALKRRIEVENAADQAKEAREEKKAQQEAERLATDKVLIPVLKEFAEALAKGLGIDLKVSDSPTTTSDVTGAEPSPLTNPNSNYNYGSYGGGLGGTLKY